MIHSITPQDVIISILWPTISVHHKVFLPRVHRSNTWCPSMAPTMLLCRWLVQGPVFVAHVVVIDYLKVVGYIQGAMFLSSPPSPYLKSTPRIQMKLILGCNRMNIMHIVNCSWIPRVIMIHGLPCTHYWYAPYFIELWTATSVHLEAVVAHQMLEDADTATQDRMLLESIAMIYLWTTVNIQNYDPLSSLSSLSSPWR